MAIRRANGGLPTPAPWPPNPYAAGAVGVSDLCSSGASTPPLAAESSERLDVPDPPVDGGTPASASRSSSTLPSETAGDEKPCPPQASSPPPCDKESRVVADFLAEGGTRPTVSRSPLPDAAVGSTADPALSHVSSPLTANVSGDSPAKADPAPVEGHTAETDGGPPLPPRPSVAAGFADSVMALRGEVARLADGHARQTELEDTVSALRRQVALIADRAAQQAATDGTNVASLRREVTRLAAATARQAEQLDVMAAAQRGLAARSTNTGRSRMVWNSYRRARAGCPPWYTFLKEREGNGPLLPGVPPLDVPEVPVGAPLPSPFPTTYEEVATLDDDDLAIICSWLHDTAGVTKGDPISTRRAKVMARLCWWG